MTISSRTPEGSPNHCSICDSPLTLEPSMAGDAPCPRCGHLLWWFQERLETPHAARQITPATSLSQDSLDVVELVMELEEEFGVTIPDEVVEKVKTVGDVVRLVAQLQARN